MEKYTDEQNERRGSLRVDLEAERILLSWLDKEGVKQTDQGICIDLSRRGALIEYKEVFKLGDLLEITFNPHNDNAVTVKGQVCRVTKCNANSHHIALQLL